MNSEFVLSMQHISKTYGENTVLNDVSLHVRPGEIHALLGENGAGKSTLMNILFGMPVIHSTGGFQGQVLLNGEKADIASPFDAIAKGIGMVHQEFMLLPGFTITENIKLNREITKPTILSRLFGKSLEKLDMPAMNRDARKALDSVGMNIEEFTLVKGLPVGYMQFVEIAREIDKKGIKLLVFDEPTAVLTESEAEQLIKVMKNIAASGISIIFITHRLDEVMAAADNITILRDGQLVATRKISETNLVEMAELMIGRRSEAVLHERETSPKENRAVALHVEHLKVDMTGEEVHDVSLDVMEGEILGIGGLAGQGKIGIPNGIMGIFGASGKVEFFGEPFTLGDPRIALKSGMAMVSEDRRGVGLLLDQSIEDNIVFNAMQINGEYLRGLFKKKTLLPIRLKDARAIRAVAKKMIKDLDIRCTSPTQHTGTLSGGNQQKVCIARALALNPRFLFVCEPTRGIDIGAKQIVLQTLVRLNKEMGMTIVMVSSELNELRSVCDRIAIVAEGKVIDILPVDAPDAAFGLAMSGISPQEGGNKNV